ncbi:hypothetical protein [Novacetimonas maltaceti]
MSQGGQVSITAAGGFDWDQNSQTVTAYDRAQAVRGNVTVRADRLIAYYRKKTPGAHAPAPTPANAPKASTTQAAATQAAATPQPRPQQQAQAPTAPIAQAGPPPAPAQDPDAAPPDASIQAARPSDRKHPATKASAPPAAPSVTPPANVPPAGPSATPPANAPRAVPAAPPPAAAPAAPPQAAGGDPDVDTSLVTHSDTLPEDLPPPDRPAAQSMGHNSPAGGGDGTPGNGGSEVYRLEAVGHVHIFNNTDQAWGDRAVYDMDQAVLVMTGTDMKMTTPQDILTARDTVEYHSREHMSVSRGNATLTTNDGRQMRADILVGYDRPRSGRTPHAAGRDAGGAGTIERVDAFGHILIRTQSEAVTGDRGVYVPDSAIARIVGNVHISRGLNEISGASAIVNMRTGIATLTDTPGSRVSGLVVPNQAGTGNKGTTK